MVTGNDIQTRTVIEPRIREFRQTRGKADAASLLSPGVAMRSKRLR